MLIVDIRSGALNCFVHCQDVRDRNRVGGDIVSAEEIADQHRFELAITMWSLSNPENPHQGHVVRGPFADPVVCLQYQVHVELSC